MTCYSIYKKRKT